MALTLIPDGERVVSDYLRDHSDVAAFGARIRGSTPEQTGEPWIHVTALGAPQDVDDPADHLVRFFLQFSCYAGRVGGQPEAVDLARTVRACLREIHRTSHDDAVVTAARIVEFHHLPDDQLLDEKGRARERVVVSADVYMHA